MTKKKICFANDENDDDDDDKNNFKELKHHCI
jgi:hypothetical protein